MVLSYLFIGNTCFLSLVAFIFIFAIELWECYSCDKFEIPVGDWLGSVHILLVDSYMCEHSLSFKGPACRWRGYSFSPRVQCLALLQGRESLILSFAIYLIFLFFPGSAPEYVGHLLSSLYGYPGFECVIYSAVMDNNSKSRKKT